MIKYSKLIILQYRISDPKSGSRPTCWEALSALINSLVIPIQLPCLLFYILMIRLQAFFIVSIENHAVSHGHETGLAFPSLKISEQLGGIQYPTHDDGDHITCAEDGPMGHRIRFTVHRDEDNDPVTGDPTRQRYHDKELYICKIPIFSWYSELQENSRNNKGKSEVINEYQDLVGKCVIDILVVL